MLKNGFLVIVGAVVLHQSVAMILFVLVGYIALGYADRYLSQKRRDFQLDYHLAGWVQDAEDHPYETKGGLSRVRLEPPDSIVVQRIAEIFRGRVKQWRPSPR
jgi:hypothetical protein